MVHRVKRYLNKIVDKRFIIKFLVMAFVLMIVNAIVFSNLSTWISDGNREKKLKLSDMGPECENAELCPDGSVSVDAQGGTLHFTDICCEIRSVTLVTETRQDGIIDGRIFCKDEGHAYSYFRNQIFRINHKYNTVTRSFQSQGKCSELKFEFDSCSKGLIVKEIILNKREAFHFRMSTFVIMLMIGAVSLFIRESGYGNVNLNLSHKRQKAALLFGILVPMGMSLFIGIASCRQGETLLYPYHKGEIEEMPVQQMMLFDAIMHGSVRIALDVDPDYLLMDNVYDESERIEKGFDSNWDLAFYNGSYYTYFGALPIIVLYGICYILTGCLPGVNFSMFLISIFGIIGCFAATYSFIRYFRIQPALLDFILGNWALLTASFYYVTAVNSDQYSLPIVFCLGFLMFGIASAYNAVLQSRSGKRIALYVVCGICLVCVVMLRPAVLLLLLAFVMPLFIGVLLDKKLMVREKVRDVLAFAIPVALGAVVVMVYNYLRFDSVFEFGARYQLTVSDIRYNHVTPDLNTILATVYHYGFEGLNFKPYFPFLFYNLDPTITYGKLVYHEAVMGVFMMPFNLLSFGILGKMRQNHDSKYTGNLETYTLGTVFGISTLLMFLDFGMGGLVGRYVADFAIGFSFVAFIVFMRMSARKFGIVQADTGSIWNCGKICYVVIVVTLIIGFLLLFSNDPIKFQIARENPDIYMFFMNLFDI